MANDPVSTVQTGTSQSASQVKREWAAGQMLALTVKQAAPAQKVLDRTEQALDRDLRSKWSGPAVEGLDRKLAEFQTALDSFQWPTDPPPWFQARLVTAPEEARGKIDGVVRRTRDSSPEVKIVSGGFDASERTSLAAGTYTFDLSLGGDEETLSVDVQSGDTWGDVLGAVKTAVNQAPIAARADVIYQNAPFELNPDMAGTGSALTLSVNPLRFSQDLQVKDVSGGLLSTLRLTAARNPLGPAEERSYQTTGLQQALPTFFSSTPTDPRAATALAVGRHDLAYAVGDADQPSSYISKAYVTGDTTTVSAGTYTFSSTYDGETRQHSVTVGSGWTWGDVLRSVGAELNGQYAWVNTASPTVGAPSTTYSQPGVTAQANYWPVPSATDQNAYSDGQSLTVTGAAGKEFSLQDVSGGLLSTLGLNTKLTGTPVSFNVRANDTWRDAYQSAATAITDAQTSLTAEVRETRVPYTSIPGKFYWHEGAYLALTQTGQRIGERVGLTDGRTGALSTMGVIDRERPGQDGKLKVDERDKLSENNTFSQDQGRVLFTLEDTFGETIPLSVTSGMDEVEKGWGRVTDAWNGLARYLKNNADLFDPALGAALEAPLGARTAGLRWLGVSSAGKSGMLWTNLDVFWKSLSADAVKARDTLWGDAGVTDGDASQPGLIPAWRQAVDGVRKNGLDAWLKPASAFDEHSPSLTSEFQLEQKHRLVKLLG